MAPGYSIWIVHAAFLQNKKVWRDRSTDQSCFQLRFKCSYVKKKTWSTGYRIYGPYKIAGRKTQDFGYLEIVAHFIYIWAVFHISYFTNREIIMTVQRTKKSLSPPHKGLDTKKIAMKKRGWISDFPYIIDFIHVWYLCLHLWWESRDNWVYP